MQQLTNGVGADEAIITMGVTDEPTITAAFESIRKAGSITITGLAAMGDNTIQLPSGMLTLYEKRIQGALFGSSNPVYDIPKLLGLYRKGDVKLDELVTRKYKLEDVNQGYEDLLNGTNIRGVIVY